MVKVGNRIEKACVVSYIVLFLSAISVLVTVYLKIPFSHIYISNFIPL